jgi:hypothetical protein
MRVQIGSKGSESVIAQDSKVRQGDSYYFWGGTILCIIDRRTLPIVLPQWCRRHLFLIVRIIAVARSLVAARVAGGGDARATARSLFSNTSM